MLCGLTPILGVIFVTNVTDVLGASWSEIESPYYDPNKLEEGQQPTPTGAYTYNGLY